MMLAKKEIIKLITDSAKESQYNYFKVLDRPEEPMWHEPMIGFAKGDDDHFAFWKKDIGDFHWLPSEAFSLKYKESAIRDSELTVISICFAQTEETMKDQAKAEAKPSTRWSASRGEWEPFIRDVCKKATDKMEEYGIRAVAIDLLPEQGRRLSEQYGPASTWSHRHAAFVCGLGTFGLSDGLITRQGKAVRFSTIIINKIIDADQRAYTKHNEWCLYYAKGTCGACIYRCPVGAITKKGHDKALCDQFLQVLKGQIDPAIRTDNVDNYYGCGLCQSRIPCQQAVPLIIKELK